MWGIMVEFGLQGTTCERAGPESPRSSFRNCTDRKFWVLPALFLSFDTV